PPLLYMLFLSHVPHRHPHSFPTRRSSDLFLTHERLSGQSLEGLPVERAKCIELSANGLRMAGYRRASAGDFLELSFRLPEGPTRSEEHTSELQSPDHLVCRLLLENKQ